MRRCLLTRAGLALLAMAASASLTQAQFRPPSAGEIIDSLTGRPDRGARERERAYEQGRRDAERERRMRREDRSGMRGWNENPRGPRCRIEQVRTMDRWGNPVIRERERCR